MFVAQQKLVRFVVVVRSRHTAVVVFRNNISVASGLSLRQTSKRAPGGGALANSARLITRADYIRRRTPGGRRGGKFSRITLSVEYSPATFTIITVFLRDYYRIYPTVVKMYTTSGGISNNV